MPHSTSFSHTNDLLSKLDSREDSLSLLFGDAPQEEDRLESVILPQAMGFSSESPISQKIP